jgi:polyisoprenoid-binding protein YceI
MKKVIILTGAIAISIMGFAQNIYTLDKNHARLSFNAVHIGISHIEGNFKTFDATFVSSKEDFSDAQIEMSADVNSINTEVAPRDADLRDNFFEASKFPKLTFKSTSFTKTSGNNHKLKGLITIHGITKPIEFNVVFNGKGQKPHTKKYSYGFTIIGKLNRQDFNVGGEPLLTGAGNEIDLKANVEFIISQ